MAFLTWFSLFLAVVTCLQGSTASVFPDLYEASVLELQAGLDAGSFSSVDLVKVLNFL
jgi:amidase